MKPTTQTLFLLATLLLTFVNTKTKAEYVHEWKCKNEAGYRKNHKCGGGSAPKPAAASYSAPAPQAASSSAAAPGSKGNKPIGQCLHGVPKRGGYCQCLFETDKLNGYTIPQTISEAYYDDAIRIRTDGFVLNGKNIMDKLGSGSRKTAGHRDAIQLIPTKKGFSNFQFMAGVMKNVQITNNKITSQGHLQGVFASDGMFSNLVITGNTVSSISAHKVTINGFISGKIQGNKGADGKLCHVELGPTRVGGNFFTGNVWILGLHPSDPYKMMSLSQIVEGDGTAHVVDKRFTVTRANDCNMVNFQLTKFSQEFARTQKIQQSNASEGNTPIAQMKNQDMRNFAAQQLAKGLGTATGGTTC